MRWYKKHKYVPQFGDERTISKFLWLPKCILNEWRWMERAYIRQRYDKYSSRTIFLCFPIDCEGWGDMKWDTKKGFKNERE